MTGVLTGFAIIAFVVLVGYLVGRAGIGGPTAGHVLNRIAFFVTNPALLFTTLAREDLRVVFSAPAAAVGLAAIASAAVYLVISRLAFPRDAARTTIGVLAAGYSNFNNIGIPVAVYVLGSASLVAPSLVIQLVLFAPIALTVLDIAARGHVSLRSILLQPVRNPMIIASVLGVVVAALGWRLPDAASSALGLLGGAAVPLVLMAFGMSLHGAAPLRAAGHRAEVIVAAVLKIAFMPLVAYLLDRLVFGIHGRELFDTVVLAALPAAQNVYNFAARYDRGVEVARDSVLLSTLLSIPAIVLIAVWLA